MTGPPEDGDGQPDGGGPPEHVDLPSAVPDRVRQRLLTGTYSARDDETGHIEGSL